MPVIDLIILISILLFIGILIKIKVNIGVSIFLSAVFAALAEKIAYSEIPRVFLQSAISSDSVRMVLIVISVTYFAELLKKTGTLSEIAENFKKIFPPRLSIPFFSLIIGILPMPGGALVSAPLVEEGSKNTQLNNIEKTAINFWFRHVWEPVSPLYPELALTASILGVSIVKIISIQWPIAIGMFLSGVLFLAKRIDNGETVKRKSKLADYLAAIGTIAPIILIISIILIFKNLPTYYAVFIGIVFLIIKKRANFKKIIESFNLRNLLNFSFLMISIFFLREVSTKSGMVDGVYQFFSLHNFPVPVILFTLPFLIGLITGISSAAIGISYSLMLPLIKANGVIVGSHLFVAYAGLWFSLLITPTHLCLSLSSEYFKSKLTDIYRVMAKGLALLAIITIVWYAILNL